MAMRLSVACKVVFLRLAGRITIQFENDVIERSRAQGTAETAM